MGRRKQPSRGKTPTPHADNEGKPASFPRASVRRKGKGTTHKIRDQEKENETDATGQAESPKLAKKAFQWTSVTAVAALIGWAVSYFLNGATQVTPAPISVTVESDQAKVTSMANLPIRAVFPSRRGLVSPRSCNQLGNLMETGAGVASPLHFQLIVQDDSNQAVFINNITVRVVRRKAVSGDLVECVPQAVANYRSINVNLDGNPPQVKFTSGGHDIPFGFTLGNSQQEIFDITASSSQAEYSFYLDLHFVVGGKSQIYEVSNHGRPFEAASSRGDPVWVWDFGSWVEHGTGQVTRTPAGKAFPDLRP